MPRDRRFSRHFADDAYGVGPRTPICVPEGYDAEAEQAALTKRWYQERAKIPVAVAEAAERAKVDDGSDPFEGLPSDGFVGGH